MMSEASGKAKAAQDEDEQYQVKDEVEWLLAEAQAHRGKTGDLLTDEWARRMAALKRLSETAYQRVLRTAADDFGHKIKAIGAAVREQGKKLRGDDGPSRSGAEDGPKYQVIGGRIYLVYEGKDGTSRTALCNYEARIVEEVVRDDGSGETQIRLAVEGTLAGGQKLPRAEVPASAFGSMNWQLEHWGSRAIVNAGMGAKDHLRAAIQTLSTNVARRTVYTHTGWRKLGSQWLYLHAAGAIGPNGPFGPLLDDQIALPGNLAHARLPEPPQGEALVAAVRASLGLLDLARDTVTVPVLSAAYRAGLGSCQVTVHLAGRSGVFKTELAALCQQHYGAGFDASNLPANWSSTANALEALAFAAKDMPVTVDDFAPHGTTADVARQHKDADRLIRNVGNHASRGRLNADLSIRAPRPPRGLILTTGEDIPRGHSLQARQAIVEIAKGDIDPQALTTCQEHAAAGVYAASVAGFLAWVAPQYEAIQGELPQTVAALRSNLSSKRAGKGHRRTPTNMAQLLVGFLVFLRFAREVGAVNDAEALDYETRARKAVDLLGQEQERIMADADPVHIFVRLLRSCLSSGEAHARAPDGSFPPNPLDWGWRAQEVGVGDHARDRWDPKGRCIGWVEGDHLYLDPDAAHVAVQQFAQGKGEGFPLSTRALGKRLGDAGLLVSTDQPNQRTTTRRVIEGRRLRVWCVLTGTVYPSPKAVHSVHSGHEQAQESQTQTREEIDAVLSVFD
jgi:hypothetical protein